MLLADMGADVVRIDRSSGRSAPIDVDPTRDIMNRGKRSVALDLRSVAGLEAAHRIIARSELLIEGFRPGTMERLGIGPDVCHERNPGLIYGRITGWGQSGPLRSAAGHDINFVALSGTLHHIGRAGETPAPPLNLIGDMGGGGLLLVTGLLAALLNARSTGRGQVIDAAMVEGSALQLSAILMAQANNQWNDARGTNFSDTGSHFYEVYETSDAKFVAVGAIEPAFYAELCTGLGIEAGPPFDHMDPSTWPTMKERFARIFASKTRDEWAALFEETDACVTPVLSPAEAAIHPHLAGRRSYIISDEVLQPAPAPRFSVTPSEAGQAPQTGYHSQEVLTEVGYSQAEIDQLVADGTVRSCAV
jgi:alpha-methylacyl-CoA racemase